jgi:hypothetical protein
MAPSIDKAPAGKTRRMSEHPRDPDEQLERSGDQLEEDLHRLEGHLDEAKDRLKDRIEDAQGPGEAEDVAGDWEDQAPDRPLGDDPEGGEHA